MGSQKSKVTLKSQQKLIIIDPKTNKTIYLNQLPTFPHGFDGLHIWQAGIILSRYVVSKPQLFTDKEILELGSGVGIGGITVMKFTKCKSCYLSDNVNQIIQNIKYNCNRNQFPKSIVIKLDWKDYMNFDRKYDIIIGSDIVYFGCPVKQLYQTIKKSLNPGGKCYIVIPDRKNYADLFLKQVQPQFFEINKVKLTDQIYRQSPLANKAEGYKMYSLLQQIDFYMYCFIRKSS